MTHPRLIDIRRLTVVAGILSLLVGAALSWNSRSKDALERFALRHTEDFAGNFVGGSLLPNDERDHPPKFFRLHSTAGEKSLLDLAAHYLADVRRILGGRGQLDFYENVVDDGFIRLREMTPETLSAASPSTVDSGEFFARLDDGTSDDVAAARDFIRLLSEDAYSPSVYPRADSTSNFHDTVTSSTYRGAAPLTLSKTANPPNAELYLIVTQDADSFPLSDAHPLNQLAVLSPLRLSPSVSDFSGGKIGGPQIEPTCSVTGFFFLFVALGLSFWKTESFAFLFGDGAEILRRFFLALKRRLFDRDAFFVQTAIHRFFLIVSTFSVDIFGDAFLRIRPTILLLA